MPAASSAERVVDVPGRVRAGMILAGFLPEQLSEPEITALVDEALAATGAAGPRDLGKVMGWLAPRTRGRADGRLVSQLAGTALAAKGGAS